MGSRNPSQETILRTLSLFPTFAGTKSTKDASTTGLLKTKYHKGEARVSEPKNFSKQIELKKEPGKQIVPNRRYQKMFIYFSKQVRISRTGHIFPKGWLTSSCVLCTNSFCRFSQYQSFNRSCILIFRGERSDTSLGNGNGSTIGTV